MSYAEAKAKYAALGVDTDAAIAKLKTVPVSLHCWQGDDVRGFDTDPTKPLTGVYVLFCEDPFTSRMSCVWMQNTDVEQYNPNAGRPNGAHRSDIWGLQAAADEGFAKIQQISAEELQKVAQELFNEDEITLLEYV